MVIGNLVLLKKEIDIFFVSNITLLIYYNNIFGDVIMYLMIILTFYKDISP